MAALALTAGVFGSPAEGASRPSTLGPRHPVAVAAFADPLAGPAGNGTIFLTVPSRPAHAGRVAAMTQAQLPAPSAPAPSPPAAAAPAPAPPPPPPPPPAPPSGPPYPHAVTGYDISWPQCGFSFPVASPIAIVGATNGQAFTTNPCFAQEAAWAGPGVSFYVNLNAPGGPDPHRFDHGPAGSCAPNDVRCASYNYGYHTVQVAVSLAEGAGHNAPMWWLDVETQNSWTTDAIANDDVIAGAIQAVHEAGAQAAVYSTAKQWSEIASADYRPGVPVWYPTGLVTSAPNAWCAASSFTGGPVYMVQVVAGPYDGDYSC